jgi:hypothetical protein
MAGGGAAGEGTGNGGRPSGGTASGGTASSVTGGAEAGVGGMGGETVNLGGASPGSCAADEWRDDGECRKFSICPDGTETEMPDTHTSDVSCGACAQGTWDNDGDPMTACVPWRVCPADSELHNGTAIRDRACMGGLWQVQFGSDGAEAVSGIALHPSGDVIVAGHTSGTLGVVNRGDYDGYVRRLSALDGSEVWTVQFGTVSFETVAGVVIEESGDLYVAGNTKVDLSGTGSLGGDDIFLFKVAGSDGKILWRRQIGGPENDYATRLLATGDGELLLTGGGALRPEVPAGPFVAKLNMTDGSDIWVAQFGSTGYDMAADVALDPRGDVIVGGATGSPSDATWFGPHECVVAKYSGDDGTLLWSTQFGSDALDQIRGVATDAAGTVYAVGITEGDLDGDGPEVHHGHVDGILQTLDGETGELGWLSQYGSEAGDFPSAVVVREGRDIVTVGASSANAEYPFAYLFGWVRGTSLSDRSELWRETYSPPDAEAYVGASLSQVAVEPQGILTLAGTTGGDLFGPLTGNAFGYDDVFVLRIKH